VNHVKNVGFNFFQVRCAHKSGDVINFIIVACRIFSRLKWYKNCKNRLRLAKVIVKNKMSRFYGSLCTTGKSKSAGQHPWERHIGPLIWKTASRWAFCTRNIGLHPPYLYKKTTCDNKRQPTNRETRARAKRTLFSAKSARTSLCERTSRFSRFFIPLCFEIES